MQREAQRRLVRMVIFLYRRARRLCAAAVAALSAPPNVVAVVHATVEQAAAAATAAPALAAAAGRGESGGGVVARLGKCAGRQGQGCGTASQLSMADCEILRPSSCRQQTQLKPAASKPTPAARASLPPLPPGTACHSPLVRIAGAQRADSRSPDGPEGRGVFLHCTRLLGSSCSCLPWAVTLCAARGARAL